MIEFPKFGDKIKRIAENGLHRIRNDAIQDVQSFIELYFEKKISRTNDITSREQFIDMITFGNHINLDRYLQRALISGDKINPINEYLKLRICDNITYSVYALLVIELLISEIIEKTIQIKPRNKKFITSEMIKIVIEQNYEYFIL